MRRFPLIFIALLLALPGFALAEETVLAIGAEAPGFELTGTDGETHTLQEYVDQATATVVVFTCNTCPYSQAYEPVLIDMAKSYMDKKVQFVLINSNDVARKPGDSFDNMVQRAKDKEFPFPYLYDATQEIARSYGAKVTPHIFLVDSNNKLRYQGRINDNRFPDEVKSHDLVDAISAVLADEAIPVASTKAFGCGIKWKKASS